jgi:hypothetical protein
LLQEAYADIKCGRLTPGWEKYDSRLVVNGMTNLLPQPLWRGEDLAGKSLLVHPEQGIGEQVWFSSCFADVAWAAERTMFVCDPHLVDLVERTFPESSVLGGGATEAQIRRWRFLDVDYQISMGSLFRYLRPSLASFPEQPGFLIPDVERVCHWSERLQEFGDGVRIGIAWQGDHDLKRLRLTPLSIWQQFLSIPGVIFVHLQSGASAWVLDVILNRWGVEVQTFEDLDLDRAIDDQAALLSALDFVIAVPNTTVHLAGAVGTPTAILHDPAWGCFWLIKDKDVPWYPAATVAALDGSYGWDRAVGKIREIVSSISADV